MQAWGDGVSSSWRLTDGYQERVLFFGLFEGQ